MIRSVCLSLILIVSFANLLCTDHSVSPREKPGAVHFLPYRSDHGWTEKGIDADSETDGIRLIWNHPREIDVQFVEVYRRGDRDQIFELVSKVFMPDTFYVDNKVTLYQKYNYYALAVNEDGVKSVSSDTLYYTLLEKAITLIPRGDMSSVTPGFSWRDPNDEFSSLIKLIDARTETPIWIYTMLNMNYGNEIKGITYNIDNTASIDSLDIGSEYLWQVSIISSQMNVGSKSSWTPFTIR